MRIPHNLIYACVGIVTALTSPVYSILVWNSYKDAVLLLVLMFVMFLFYLLGIAVHRVRHD